MWFTRVSIQNPVFATMVMLAFVVLGLFSYQRLQVDQWPDIEFPVVVITTDYPGASPESIESEVSRKIEEAVNSINGIKVVASRSYEGSSLVWVEFDWGTDVYVDRQVVSEKLQLVLNRSSRSDEITESEIEKALRHPVYWQLPNDYRACINAINAGRPVVTGNHSALAGRYQDLASRLSGISPPEKRGGLRRLFSASAWRRDAGSGIPRAADVPAR